MRAQCKDSPHVPLYSLLSSHKMYALCIGHEVYRPTVSIPSPQDSHLPFHFRSHQMPTHLLSSSLGAAWANRTTNGWNCICGERLSILAGPHTQQFATHCQGKKHKAVIAPPLKAKRQLPMTQFFSAAAAPAPPADDDLPPPGEIEGEAKWEIPEEEKAILQVGLSAWQKQLVAQKSLKEKKRVQEKHRKMKGEVALQREILAKASSRKKKKAARRAEKKSNAAGGQSKRPRSGRRYRARKRRRTKKTRHRVDPRIAKATAAANVAAVAAAVV